MYCLDKKKRLKFLDNKFMLCCIHTSNLRVHTSIFTVYEKKLVEVSVRKTFGVIMNSFSQFHSTFIRKHSRFFVRVGHKPKSIVYKVCTYMSSGNLFFFSLSSSEEYLWIFWKKYLKRLFVKMYQFLSALTATLVQVCIWNPWKNERSISHTQTLQFQYLYALNLHLMKVLSLLLFTERLHKASSIFM